MTLGLIGVKNLSFGHGFYGYLGSKNDYQTNTEQANKTEQMGFLFCSTKTDEANRTEHNPLGLFCLFVLMWVVLHYFGAKL